MMITCWKVHKKLSDHEWGQDHKIFFVGQIKGYDSDKICRITTALDIINLNSDFNILNRMKTEGGNATTRFVGSGQT